MHVLLSILLLVIFYSYPDNDIFYFSTPGSWALVLLDISRKMIFLLLLRTCIDILFLGHVMSCLEFLRNIFCDLEYYGVTYTLADFGVILVDLQLYLTCYIILENRRRTQMI